MSGREGIDQPMVRETSTDPTRPLLDFEENMKAQARVALLGYYKDQLVSHATILMSLALLTFTALTAWNQLGLDLLYFPTIWAAFAVGAWQAFRFILYARMAMYTISASPLPPRPNIDPIFEENNIQNLRRGVRYIIGERVPQRWVLSLARPRPRGVTTEVAAFYFYSLVGLIGIIWLLWEQLVMTDPILRLWFAFNPYVLWCGIWTILSAR